MLLQISRVVLEVVLNISEYLLKWRCWSLIDWKNLYKTVDLYWEIQEHAGKWVFPRGQNECSMVSDI